MVRSRKYLKYFGKSFCADKTAVTLMVLIVITLLAIIGVWFGVPTPENAEVSGDKPDLSDFDNKDGAD